MSETPKPTLTNLTEAQIRVLVARILRRGEPKVTAAAFGSFI
jgi:hypothetical protein